MRANNLSTQWGHNNHAKVISEYLREGEKGREQKRFNPPLQSVDIMSPPLLIRWTSPHFADGYTEAHTVNLAPGAVEPGAALTWE